MEKNISNDSQKENDDKNDKAISNQASNVDSHYMEFSLGEENYAIPLLKVREVISTPDTTLIPNSPSYFVGIMNLRGQVITVVDLRKKMGINSECKHKEEAVIIVDIHGINLGIVVDSINKVLEVDMTKLSDISGLKGKINTDYFIGSARFDGVLVTLLDLEKVFTSSRAFAA
ncbi:MAG: purine-binding chemotaxis protein CheW [Halobacteriovoraceae bacterium]|nr:purine-binding chemotaxis protein CheW [Halobacteriovoraceae bacterium]